MQPSIWVRRIPAAQLPVQPWRNGGGQTRLIAVWPPDAGMDDFSWRISAADVACDGPFSVWPDVDRVLLLTAGGPLRLSAPGRSSVVLHTGGPLFRFAGETAWQATLQGPEVRDFNLMMRRGRVSASVGRCTEAFTLVQTPGHTVLHVARGRFRVLDAQGGPWHGHELQAQDTVWLSDHDPDVVAPDAAHWQRAALPDAGLRLVPLGTAVLVRVHLRGGPAAEPH